MLLTYVFMNTLLDVCALVLLASAYLMLFRSESVLSRHNFIVRLMLGSLTLGIFLDLLYYGIAITNQSALEATWCTILVPLTFVACPTWMCLFIVYISSHIRQKLPLSPYVDKLAIGIFMLFGICSCYLGYTNQLYTLNDSDIQYNKFYIKILYMAAGVFIIYAGYCFSYMKKLANNYTTGFFFSTLLPASSIILTAFYPQVTTVFFAFALSSFLCFYENQNRSIIEQNQKLVKAQELENILQNNIYALANIYLTLHVVNLKNETFFEYRAPDYIRDMIKTGTNAPEMIKLVAQRVVVEKDLERILDFTNLKTLEERLKGKKLITDEFRGKNTGWFRASFIPVSYDEYDNLVDVIFTTLVIDNQKKREEMLKRISRTDELTQLPNRRDYNDVLEDYSKSKKNNVFIVVMDVNGLKRVNDTLGHIAGDELISAAASCMKQAFQKEGAVFRTGGDEFIALTEVSRDQLEQELAELNKLLYEYKGRYVSKISVAVGFACRSEYPQLSMEELGDIAEKRMYEDKSAYYKRTGIERRKL